MQQRELTEEVKRVIHHEGDRVIEAVTSGPHERIIDPDIHAIWKDMVSTSSTRWPISLQWFVRRDGLAT